jgi:hypothetical protein
MGKQEFKKFLNKKKNEELAILKTKDLNTPMYLKISKSGKIRLTKKFPQPISSTSVQNTSTDPIPIDRTMTEQLLEIANSNPIPSTSKPNTMTEQLLEIANLNPIPRTSKQNTMTEQLLEIANSNPIPRTSKPNTMTEQLLEIANSNTPMYSKRKPMTDRFEFDCVFIVIKL